MESLCACVCVLVCVPGEAQLAHVAGSSFLIIIIVILDWAVFSKAQFSVDFFFCLARQVVAAAAAVAAETTTPTEANSRIRMKNK